MRQGRRIGAILFVLAVAASAAAQPRTASHAYVPQATGDTGEASEVLAANQQLAQRTGSSLAVKPGAYAAALRQKARIAARANTVAASTSAWKAYGRGPLIGDDARFSRIAFNGHADLGGRVNHFAYDSGELLGKGLPNVPVFSMAFKPKASSSEPDTLYVGTHGRSIYTYQFPAGL